MKKNSIKRGIDFSLLFLFTLPPSEQLRQGVEGPCPVAIFEEHSLW